MVLSKSQFKKSNCSLTWQIYVMLKTVLYFDCSSFSTAKCWIYNFFVFRIPNFPIENKIVYFVNVWITIIQCPSQTRNVLLPMVNAIYIYGRQFKTAQIFFNFNFIFRRVSFLKFSDSVPQALKVWCANCFRYTYFSHNEISSISTHYLAFKTRTKTHRVNFTHFLNCFFETT